MRRVAQADVEHHRAPVDENGDGARRRPRPKVRYSGQTSGHSRDTPGSGVRGLPCGEFIGTQPPERDMRVVLGVVGLPTSPHLRRALQTARSGLHDPAARLFAKWGLAIRAGARFRLTVPDRLRNQFSIGSGNAGEDHRGTTIVVNDCSGSRGAKGLDYAGGYNVRDPFCAPLIVAAHRQRRRVRIGVGKACPDSAHRPSRRKGERSSSRPTPVHTTAASDVFAHFRDHLCRVRWPKRSGTALGVPQKHPSAPNSRKGGTLQKSGLGSWVDESLTS